MKIKGNKNIKKFWILAIGLFICILIPFLINWHVCAYASAYILEEKQVPPQKVDCILVLGAGLKGDTPGNTLKDRLLVGTALYNSNASDRLLMSGDHGRKDYDEVNAMKDFALEGGIPSSHIFMDHAGFSTYESMVRAQEVFAVRSTIIVTQEYHLYRAVYIARRLGLEAYGVSADLRPYAGKRYNNTREFFARIKDFFYILFRPSPTYLGEVIAVNGNGDLTNDRIE